MAPRTALPRLSWCCWGLGGGAKCSTPALLFAGELAGGVTQEVGIAFVPLKSPSVPNQFTVGKGNNLGTNHNQYKSCPKYVPLSCLTLVIYMYMSTLPTNIILRILLHSHLLLSLLLLLSVFLLQCCLPLSSRCLLLSLVQSRVHILMCE